MLCERSFSHFTLHGHYTLAGRNEIRAEITKLIGKKKAIDEDNGGSDHVPIFALDSRQ